MEQKNYIRTLLFYTDGAYSSKTEMGGWATICVEDNVIIDTQTGYEPYTTGNRMELSALYSALLSADSIETGHTKVLIHTDSAYLANTFNEGWYLNWLKNGWKTSDKQCFKNQDLWRPIIALYIKIANKFDIEIIKVKGHKDDKWNIMADRLAVKARSVLEEVK